MNENVDLRQNAHNKSIEEGVFEILSTLKHKDSNKPVITGDIRTAIGVVMENYSISPREHGGDENYKDELNKAALALCKWFFKRYNSEANNMLDGMSIEQVRLLRKHLNYAEQF